MKFNWLRKLFCKEFYYNNKYPKINKTYKKQFLKKNREIDVRLFLGNYNNQKMVKFFGKEDEIAMKCLDWVIRNLHYRSDKYVFKMQEYWAFSFETLFNKMGDCDDGAILLYDLLRKSGIPPWKIRLVAGWAIEPKTNKQIGHAYVSYYSNKYDKWVALDWSFSPNKVPISEQPDYKENKMYGDVWFSFNEDYCWGSNIKIGRQK